MDEDPVEAVQMRPLLTSGLDEEAMVDYGSSSLQTYVEEELEGHRAVPVLVHAPLEQDRSKKHYHHHRTETQHHEMANESEMRSPDSVAQRVHLFVGNDDTENLLHQLYLQLDELQTPTGEGTQQEWTEKARWLKFEEDVEEGGQRWSKPHVATLYLHSLNLLRDHIKTGTVLLDLEARSMDEITDRMLDCMVTSGQLEESLKARVKETLMRRHHNQSEMKLSHRLPLVRSFADIGKKHPDSQLLEKNGLLPPPEATPGNAEVNSSVDHTKMDLHFMKKIQTGAEACNVLVGQVDFLQSPISAFVRLSPGVMLSGLTEVPVPTRFLFLLLGPPGRGTEYHEIGRSISTLMVDEVFHDVAYKARDRDDLLSGLDEFLYSTTVLPPGEWDPSIRIEPPKTVPSRMKRTQPSCPNGEVSNPDRDLEHQPGPELQRTGRIFGGLVADVRRKRPFYWSDFRDGLSLQCLASILFLYCACMSPVITFGGLLGEATKGNISAIESLFGASITGIAYSLFAGQPLTILGSTGPILVFEKILFKFCSDYELEYLPFRTAIGLWTAIFCLLLVATDFSFSVCFITRFTEEAFAALISLIFIYEALEKLFHLGKVYPYDPNYQRDNLTHLRTACFPPGNITAQIQEQWSSENLTSSAISWAQLGAKDCARLGGTFRSSPYVPDVLFWSIILFFSTFLLSTFLKQFKSQRYFSTKVRSIISDFAVFLTILIMVLIDFLIGVPSPKLQVPDRFEPTSSHRGWFVSPLGNNPWWSLLAAAVPALLCTILIFMDQQITAVIVNRKENKLKKGCGYHLDLLVVSVMLAVCTLMGLPWFVAATVLSITHVHSLKREAAGAAPGEQPAFLGVTEQRLTGFCIFFLMGCSVFMTSILKFIPMPVLYGVFLYMGVSSLRGIQLFDRVKLFLMPTKHQPDLIYLRYVPLWKVHAFTAVQVGCLAALWAIKTTPAAVIFPVMVLALVFVRKLLDCCCFTKKELSYLDDLIPEVRKKKDDDQKKHRESLRQQQLAEAFQSQRSFRSRLEEDAPEVQVEEEEPRQSTVDSETSL